MIKILFFFISLTLFFSFDVFAQKAVSDKEGANEEYSFPINTNIVLLDLAILDREGQVVSGLTATDLKVYEDNIEQKIEFFNQENTPVSFGLVIDTSGSMRFKLPMVTKAAKEMLKFCKEGDEIFVVSMKDHQNIKIVQPFTENFSDVTKVLDSFVIGGGTALLNGISDAAQYAQAKSKNRRKVIIVMSDGDERSSIINQEQLVNNLRVTDTQVYLLGFPEGFTTPNGKFIDYTLPRAKKLLNKIAQESGGEAFFPTSLEDVLPILERVCVDLQTQYTIGYYPKDFLDGRWHKIEVKLTNKKSKYIVRTRTGYFAKNKKDKEKS